RELPSLPMVWRNFSFAPPGLTYLPRPTPRLTPWAVFFRGFAAGALTSASPLLDRDRCLRSVDCDGLQAGIAGSSSSDGQGSLSVPCRLKSECDHGALTGNSAGAGRAGGRNRRLS